MEKSRWLVEVSAFLGVGPSGHARLVTPPDMEMGEAWPNAMAAYCTINFHFDLTLGDIEVASVSSLREESQLVSVCSFLSPVWPIGHEIFWLAFHFTDSMLGCSVTARNLFFFNSVANLGDASLSADHPATSHNLDRSTAVMCNFVDFSA